MSVDLTYERIEPGRLIAYTERLLPAGRVEAVALATVLIQPDGAASRLSVTLRLASFRDNMRAGYEQGNGAAFDNLARFLA